MEQRRVSSASCNDSLLLRPTSRMSIRSVQVGREDISHQSGSLLGLQMDKKIMTGSRDGSARVWHLHSHSPMQWTLGATLRGHVGMVWSLAWAPDGKRALTAGHDGLVRIWRMDSHESPESGITVEVDLRNTTTTVTTTTTTSTSTSTTTTTNMTTTMTSTTTTTNGTATVSGSMSFTAANLTEAQVEAATKVALATHLEVDHSSVTATASESRRLVEDPARRLVGNKWVVSFGASILASQADAVEAKLKAIEGDPSAFENAMKTELENAGASAVSLTILSFAA